MLLVSQERLIISETYRTDPSDLAEQIVKDGEVKRPILIRPDFTVLDGARRVLAVRMLLERADLSLREKISMLPVIFPGYLLHYGAYMCVVSTVDLAKKIVPFEPITWRRNHMGCVHFKMPQGPDVWLEPIEINRAEKIPEQPEKRLWLVHGNHLGASVAGIYTDFSQAIAAVEQLSPSIELKKTEVGAHAIDTVNFDYEIYITEHTLNKLTY